MNEAARALIPLAILAAGAAAVLACGRRSGASGWVAFAASAAAAVAGIPPALSALLGAPPWTAGLPWSLPWGSLSIGLDPLSGFFFLLILLLSVPAAAFGKGYLAGKTGRWAGASWAFFLLLEACMAGVVLARDGLLFLLFWEGMSLASFFLVVFDHEEGEVLGDGLVYLTATHLGAACLAGLFGIWGAPAGTLAFSALAARPLSSGAAWAVLLLALGGFGSKAGLVPFHVWLPRAHPAAPSHVSALLSGVMIKMGVYGLLRVVLLAGSPPAVWGYVLLALGVLSAVGGVAYALAQHDLKRLLAYHSVENVGIIVLALGAGVVARSAGMEGAARLAFAGALLHTLNHALFKGLLFFSGGAAAQAAGTRNLESLGGLLKRMPITGSAFLAGSVSICALPPFNGFVSEWLVYTALLTAALAGKGTPSLVLLGTVPALALVGGLALACFAKASGIAFLGEARSAGAASARERSAWMTLPMVALAAACLLVGLGAPWAVRLALPAAADLAGAAGELDAGLGPLAKVAAAGGGLLLLAGGLLALRSLLLRRRPTAVGPTWGCGYTAATPRMQYTASSFAQPLLGVFPALVRASLHLRRPKGLFPRAASFESHFPDPADRVLFDPLVEGLLRLARVLKPLQQGRLQVYLLYVLIALVSLLLWQASP